MDNKLDCVWKDKKCPEKCKHPKHKDEKCHCDLEPCSLYKQRYLLKLLKNLLDNNQVVLQLKITKK